MRFATVSVASCVPAVANACPACAANPGETPTMFVALAGFLLVPFVIAFVVIAVIKRLESDP